MLKQLSAEERMKIREKVKMGKSRCKVAKEFGVDRSTVYYHTRDLPRRKQKRLTAFEKQRIWEEVKRGKSRYKVAKEFDVDPWTVYSLTKDLPKKKAGKKSIINNSMKREIRKLVKSGMTRHEVAKEFSISPNSVCAQTKDLKDNRGKSIRGFTLKVLKKIVKEGYIIPEPYTGAYLTKHSYRTLKKYIPIKKAEIGRRNIYFIEGRGKEAFRAFLKIRKGRMMSYQQLCAIMPLFGIPKKDYREAVFGKSSMKEKVIKGLNAKKRALSDAVSDNFGRFLLPKLLV